jgi:hypothetical protein
MKKFANRLYARRLVLPQDDLGSLVKAGRII